MKKSGKARHSVTCIIPALKYLRKEDLKFKGSLGYMQSETVSK